MRVPQTATTCASPTAATRSRTARAAARPCRRAETALTARASSAIRIPAAAPPRRSAVGTGTPPRSGNGTASSIRRKPSTTRASSQAAPTALAAARAAWTPAANRHQRAVETTRLGAGDGAVERLRELVARGECRLTNEAWPRLRQVGRRFGRQLARHVLDAREPRRRRSRERRADCFVRTPREVEPAERVRAEATDPAEVRPARRERAAAAVGALDGVDHHRRACSLRERSVSARKGRRSRPRDAAVEAS